MEHEQKEHDRWAMLEGGFGSAEGEPRIKLEVTFLLCYVIRASKRTRKMEPSK
jgi:hypothetical protein